MAEVLIQNMRDPSQQITAVVTLRQMIIPTVDPSNPMWILEASTIEEDEDGDMIEPVRVYLSNHDTLTEDINGLITQLCKKVNWTYVEDTTPPKIVSHWPMKDATDVSVDTEIIINLEEAPPSAGIDLDSIRVKVKGFDLTNQVTIKGDFRSCSLLLTPGTKYKSALKKSD
jgi:hypothetical protein